MTALNQTYELSVDETLRELRVLTIPLCGNEWAAIRVPFPMTEAQWDQMLALLTLMKKGIVAEDVAATEDKRA